MPARDRTDTRRGALDARERLAATGTYDRRITKAPAPLWIVQGVLAAIFLFAGGMKLVLPADTLTEQTALPALFLRFIGVCEVLGAAGLILPGLLLIRPGLTPLAATGLVIIMAGATVLTAAGGDIAPAFFPLVLGLLAALVAYGRVRVAPQRRPNRP